MWQVEWWQWFIWQASLFRGMRNGRNMATGGGYEPLPTEVPEGESNPGYDDNDEEENERTRWQEEHSSRRSEGGGGIEMKHRSRFISSPPLTKTSTSKSGEQETSFTDTPSGENILEERERHMKILHEDIHDVFPNIDNRLIPRIRRGSYTQLIINLGKKNSVDHVIAFDGRPNPDINLSKFPKGLRKALGKTNVQINKEAYVKQKYEEEKQAKREQELEQARRDKAENDEKLRDAEERRENLQRVVKEQEEAGDHALTTEDKESHTRSTEASRNALRQVSKEVDELRVERDRMEQAEKNADESVQEGKRQVETARERVNQRLLSLRDRVKEIFKKHGFTVVAVVSAIATVIGVIVSNLKAGLTKVANGVGNGLKELGAKLGQILPGMVGAIASFLFRTAGEVIGFLAKNAWLLIVGLVVLAVEQFKKKG